MIDGNDGLRSLGLDAKLAHRDSLLRELVEAGEQLVRCERELARGMVIGDEPERAARARKRWEQVVNRAKRLGAEGARE